MNYNMMKLQLLLVLLCAVVLPWASAISEENNDYSRKEEREERMFPVFVGDHFVRPPPEYKSLPGREEEVVKPTIRSRFPKIRGVCHSIACTHPQLYNFQPSVGIKTLPIVSREEKVVKPTIPRRIPKFRSICKSTRCTHPELYNFQPSVGIKTLPVVSREEEVVNPTIPKRIVNPTIPKRIPKFRSICKSTRCTHPELYNFQPPVGIKTLPVVSREEEVVNPTIPKRIPKFRSICKSLRCTHPELYNFQPSVAIKTLPVVSREEEVVNPTIPRRIVNPTIPRRIPKFRSICKSLRCTHPELYNFQPSVLLKTQPSVSRVEDDE